MKGIQRLISKVMRGFAGKKQTPAQGDRYSLDFSKVYRENLFQGDDSISGQGSDLKQTEVLREELPKCLNELGVKVLLDIPCGDFNWMRHVDVGDIKYIGGDIVDELIESNTAKFNSDKRSFFHLDLTQSSLPEADAVFCRDCLVHLNFEQCVSAIENVKRSGAKYLLTTTFTTRESNLDLVEGIWRPLNLCKAPFNFPDPVLLINEQCTEDNCNWTDKCVGVWRVVDIPEVKL